MDFFRRPIVYIVLILVIAFGGIYYYVKKKTATTSTESATTTTVSNLSNLDPDDFDDQIKVELSQANTEAAKVRSDYKLSMIEVDIDNELSVNSLVTRYVYSSSSDTVNNWLMTFTQRTQNSLRALIPKDDYASEITPIDMTAWKYNYVTALQLAEKAGGLDWRESNSFNELQLYLENQNSKLIWSVQYVGDTTETSKVINLDASTGAVVTE